MAGANARDFSLTLRLSEPTYLRLQELRRATGRNSVDEVALEAIDGYLRTLASPAALERVTPRQREVLKLIAEGDKTREIARKLNISVKTVEMHRAQLMETLELRNIADVVRFAVRAGVISP
jgi:DNA-binding NarL/FixJ family response regulator